MVDAASEGPRLAEPPSFPPAALLVALLCFLGGAVVASVLGSIAVSAGDGSNGAGTVLLGEIGLWGGMVAAAVVVARRYGTGSVVADFGYRIGPRDLWPGVGAAVVGLVLADALGLLSDAAGLHGSNTKIITDQRSGSVSFVVVTVVVAVGAPVFEELFFRGVLRGCLGRLGSHGAVWAQAVIFGLAHYRPSGGVSNVPVMVIVGSLGVVLGYTARATRRLGPGMIAHGLFNSVQVALVV